MKYARRKSDFESDYSLKALGLSFPFPQREELSQLYSFAFPAHSRLVHRFQLLCKVFHSFQYTRKGSSASFYAILFDNRFVKIDYVVIVNDLLYCLCTELR